MPWTPEKREQLIEAYEAENPTPENSMDIVTELADQFGETVNGVRMVLSKAGVYVKKSPAAKAKSNGAGRTSKADAHEALTKAITDAGQDPDEEIISKLTGKAAVYLASVINSIS